MHIDTNGFEIDDKVRDRITGLEGIVIGITMWTTGCARAVVQPRIDKEGKVPESISIDVLSLEMVKAGPRHEAPAPVASIGGPRPTPTRGR